ncbi:MAG: hypothetical protein MJZ26_01720 [Fibrobacter sp.]|nr:hypothetical protein [Fibrobacter sp.]
MGRKLASIQKIWKVEPIDGADRIELVSVLGWKCVSKKGEFKEGDLLQFCDAAGLSHVPIEECGESLPYKMWTA